ncbi:MAG: hypothetical protein WCY51_07360 [Sulfurimonas sp.]|uniref:hypothetical protein n=1 Tax=Sulfurimonas sp. TaxID=2022749 RepID=UPI0025FA4A7E|nr:hypothetical protein [Sulfurimonas sp.]MCK9455206.1 hypothetical protein [Sulfurimonas sp.]
MKEIDWDSPDPDNEEGVIDFEDMSPEKEPQREVVSVKKPTPPPSPPKKEAGMSEKQEKIITNATKSAQKLSKELETLDYQIEKFSKFEQKVSSFKIKNTIAIGAVALFLGGYIGSLAQSELNNYYINQELKGRQSTAAAELELIQKAKKRGVIFAIDEDRIVVWTTTQNKAVSVAQNDQHKIFEIDLKKVKK